MSGRRGAAAAIMAASGFAGLGLQIVWTQQNALWLGHEAAAMLAVVAAFFGGVALGSLYLSRRIDDSARPARWYAACEAVIGLWSFALALLMPQVSGWLLNLIGAQPAPLRQWSVVFGGTFLLLLPATAAMGATLPAMERVVAALRARDSAIAMLYAANTSGAVLGVLAAAFVLVPQFGLRATAVLCALTNLCCAWVALKLFPAQRPAKVDPTSTPARAQLGVLAATGLLGIGYEVLVVRVLSQVAENTVYTFAILLSVYLVGTALGAAAYSRWRTPASQADPLLRTRLLQMQAAACLLGIVALAVAGSIKTAALNVLGPGLGAALAVEALLAIAAFLLPTIVMGALFSHLATAARASGIGFGHALGVNTLGAAFAPLICGLLLLPALGSTTALLLVVAGYLLLTGRGSWRTWPQVTALAATGAMAVLCPRLATIAIPDGGRLVTQAEGVSATVSVVEDANGIRTLHINNRQQEGSSATQYSDARQAALPLLLHPAPRRALFLGLGTGATARTASEDTLLAVDAVELLPEVIDAAAQFIPDGAAASYPRLRMLTADARRFVRAASDRYDVIVADNFHPARSGSGALYTTEHFSAVRQRLAARGVFCQWLPLHQLDLDTLRSIVRSFTRVFPHSFAMLATNSLDTPVLGLLARRDGERFELAEVRTRLVAPDIPRDWLELGFADDLALLGSFIAGPAELVEFAGVAPLNTDDRPVVMYSAPRITYAPDSAPRDRLIVLLNSVAIESRMLVGDSGDTSWDQRLDAYWAARNKYLEIGRDVRPTADLRAMLAQVREPLLAVLETSPDFRPAYDPLLRMAAQLAEEDAPAARTLLAELANIQPARPEAMQMLGRLPTRH